MEEDKEFFDKITFQALLKARKAFERYIAKHGYDPCYWRIDFKATILSEDFKPLRTISLKRKQ